MSGTRLRRARMLAGRPAKAAARGLVTARTIRWAPHSRLFAVGDRGGWSVEEDAAHVVAAARRLGYPIGPAGWAGLARRQSVFLTSHFEALSRTWLDSSHRLATAYMHGRPGTPGAPEFDACFDALRGQPERISRIQVTHAEMHELVLAAGVDDSRVLRIPLGIDLENFDLVDADRRFAAREALGLPHSAFVIGSFQKDGVGWGEGLEPKLVKGPDVFVRVVDQLRARVPELTVLLTGPSRGYVKQELDRIGVPWTHVLAGSRRELAQAYHALDVYLVASRQEGGPKAVLESLASGVPLVSTRVGQAPEIVEDGVDGRLCEVGDVDALAVAVELVRENGTGDARAHGRTTAERYAQEKLDPLWAGLLEGFVERGSA